MDKYQEVEKKHLPKILLDNFLGGIAWGLGATLGAAIILTLIGFIFKQIDVLPIVGDWVSQINYYASHKNPNLMNTYNITK